MISFSLAGKTAMVTGASSGIGKAIAVALGDAGAHVICAGRADFSETVSHIKSAEHLRMDLDDPVVARDFFESCTVDILVNDADFISSEASTGISESAWETFKDINLKALFVTCQAFAQSVFARSSTGKIVNIASVLSFRGILRAPSYTASKHGVAELTQALANEWARNNINVNAIAPGYILTNKTKVLCDDEVRNLAILERIPAGRWGYPEDVAGTAVFLAASASDYVHGTVFNVDGGCVEVRRTAGARID